MTEKQQDKYSSLSPDELELWIKEAEQQLAELKAKDEDLNYKDKLYLACYRKGMEQKDVDHIDKNREEISKKKKALARKAEKLDDKIEDMKVAFDDIVDYNVYGQIEYRRRLRLAESQLEEVKAEIGKVETDKDIILPIMLSRRNVDDEDRQYIAEHIALDKKKLRKLSHKVENLENRIFIMTAAKKDPEGLEAFKKVIAEMRIKKSRKLEKLRRSYLEH